MAKKTKLDGFGFGKIFSPTPDTPRPLDLDDVVARLDRLIELSERRFERLNQHLEAREASNVGVELQEREAKREHIRMLIKELNEAVGFSNYGQINMGTLRGLDRALPGSVTNTVKEWI